MLTVRHLMTQGLLVVGLVSGIALGVWSGTGWAHPVGASTEVDVSAKLKAVVEQKFPGIQIRRVEVTEIPEWYLVETETDSPDGIMYMHRDGRYVLAGNVFDLDGGRNLTSELSYGRHLHVLSALNATNTVELKPLRAPVSGPLIIFDDPDCPVCRQMHGEVKKLVEAGVPVSVVLFPLMSIHPDAYRKSVAIWCAEDREAVLHHAMASQPVEVRSETCSHPIDENLRLAKRLGVHKTPTVFLPNGRRIEGFHSASDLLSMLHLGQPVASVSGVK
jgi:thiol:disulfide interchange protein DsbC